MEADLVQDHNDKVKSKTIIKLKVAASQTLTILLYLAIIPVIIVESISVTWTGSSLAHHGSGWRGSGSGGL